MKRIGGIYNFVTKRGLCIGKNSKISWTQVETGSSITWKYPSCVLVGNNSNGEFYSVALTNNYQQADTGTKMIHLGEKTTSKIISKESPAVIQEIHIVDWSKLDQMQIMLETFHNAIRF